MPALWFAFWLLAIIYEERADIGRQFTEIMSHIEEISWSAIFVI